MVKQTSQLTTKAYHGTSSYIPPQNLMYLPKVAQPLGPTLASPHYPLTHKPMQYKPQPLCNDKQTKIASSDNTAHLLQIKQEYLSKLALAYKKGAAQN